MKALVLAATLILGIAVSSSADNPQIASAPTKGVYVVTGRVVSGTLIANFGLNIGDIVLVSEDGRSMTVQKSGRRFPLGSSEPNLVKLEDKVAERQAAVEADAKDLEGLKSSLAKGEADQKDIVARMETLIASVPVNTIYCNNANGGYYISSQSSMTNEQSQLFYDLNKRLDSIRREMKQLRKKLPEAENALEHSKKTLATYEAALADFRKTNPLPRSEDPDRTLKERLAKLKNLFTDGLLTKEQYDRSVKETLDAAVGIPAQTAK